ncbi:hypothetical protein E3E14_25160 [Streptomyces sp. ICN441]|uniref:hypothetical protein n=1 Tax=Streptomyces sp. ICN441 TaxID=2558286 RepID=UPI001068E5D8|nr:hypothetical protein [Streptomyces sp. ICN441]TFE42476.1 hypothetical protein E3E14_25160 [Streptomyces sp. ICN441]
MFIRRSTYQALCRRAETYRQAELNARRALAALVGTSARAAEQFVAADDRTNATEHRLDRALRACARYRSELADTARRTRRLEQQLDDALGLNTPGVTAGSLWQERRADKRTGPKP